MINIKDCPLMFYTSNRSLIKKEEIHEPQNNKNMDFCVYIYIYILAVLWLLSLSAGFLLIYSSSSQKSQRGYP